MTIVGYRIAAPSHATTAKEMLSGRGAEKFGGRWNHPGTRMVYLGSSKALAAMELLVHLQRHQVLQEYRVLAVTFDASHMLDVGPLPDDWNSASMTTGAADIGEAWSREKASLILRVPSVVVAAEYNYILNPDHPDMPHLTIGSIEPFKFDSRLLK